MVCRADTYNSSKEKISNCHLTYSTADMLIQTRKYVERHGGNLSNLVLEGQEGN
jgi:hypothetical protein